MSEPETHTLDVPGTVLHYDVRQAEASAAPILLMIGSPMDASGFASLAEHFRDRTVVTYDPRGIGRSQRTDGASESAPEQHADDLHRLIAAVNGLALVARHPEQVRTLVAHEPPAAQVLPDREQALAAVVDIRQTYERDGVGPAIRSRIGERTGPPRRGGGRRTAWHESCHLSQPPRRFSRRRIRDEGRSGRLRRYAAPDSHREGLRPIPFQERGAEDMADRERARARVQAVIDRRVASGAEVGMQVVVVWRGEVVVDAVSGVADPGKGQTVRPDMLFWAASTAKGVASAVAHVLMDGASSLTTCGRSTSGPSSAPTARTG